MSERQESPYDITACRWLALVERRQQNFIELWNTGRWQHYYTHAQFLDEMRRYWVFATAGRCWRVYR
jgi:hypothetical protein